MTEFILQGEKSIGRPFITDALLFGVDSRTPAHTKLQNNLLEFEWVRRNKLYPVFWGRNINDKDALTKEEINFLHRKCCKIALQYVSHGPKNSEANGKQDGKEAVELVESFQVPKGKVVFLEIPAKEEAIGAYMKGFCQTLLEKGYVPGFKANTDALYSFDREFGGAYRAEKEIMCHALIWALAPTLEDFDQIETTHLILPDRWKPYAPSVMTRKNIAVWQYGKHCHEIFDDDDNLTHFNINLVRDESIIIHKMY